MFVPIKFKAQVELTPYEMDSEFETTLLLKLRRIYEGKCSKHGYIKPGSISIAKRSAGMLTKQHFNGHIRYDTLCRADVCNPVQGMVLSAIVRNKNQLGLLAESSVTIGGKELAILDIIVPGRAAGISSEVDVDSVQISDRINVEVLGKRYQLQDTKISIIGRVVIDNSPKETASMAAAPITKVKGGNQAQAEDGEENENEDAFDDDNFTDKLTAGGGEEISLGGDDNVAANSDVEDADDEGLDDDEEEDDDDDDDDGNESDGGDGYEND